MNENILRNSYTQHPDDQEITSFTHGDGFSILRSYPKKFGISRRDVKMLIRLFFSNGKFEFSIVVTRKNSEDRFDILSPLKYRVRNIVSNFDNPTYQFNPTTHRIINVLSREEYNIEKFVDKVLIKKHLSANFFAPLKRYLSKQILRTVFWLTDNKYDFIETEKTRLRGWYSIDEKNVTEQTKTVPHPESTIHPFLKIFKIPKNLLFVSSIIIVAVSTWLYIKYSYKFDLDLSNVSTIIYIFILFFLLEFISKKILEQLNSLKDPKKEIVLHKMHSLQFDNPDII